MVLLGMVPVLMQTPPTTLRISTSATRLPFFTAETAARCPEGPEPMTRRSYFAIFFTASAPILSPTGDKPGQKSSKFLYQFLITERILRLVLLCAITERALFPGNEFQKLSQLLEQIRELACSGISLLQIRERDLPAAGL